MSKKPSGLEKHLSTFSLSSRRSRSSAPSDEANDSEPEPGPEHDPTHLTPNTVWECHKCRKPVKVGLVGQFNYDAHVDSKDCVKEVARLKKAVMLSKGANFMLSVDYVDRLIAGHSYYQSSRDITCVTKTRRVFFASTTFYRPAIRVKLPQASPRTILTTPHFIPCWLLPAGLFAKGLSGFEKRIGGRKDF
ncbi:hypothetical protein K438DRAFT_1766876 [Mycena galopus ATCC 62051]|nr:hypothetical protein K438DRAFT_1766876 [Mycena galopus ATCC 62051]